MLGEIGGIQELLVSNAVKRGDIKKPIIGWCIGTSSYYFGNKVQFGHAGASATEEYESAIFKNEYMKIAGIKVPTSFETLTDLVVELSTKYNCHITNLSHEKAMIKPNLFNNERKQAHFFSSISNELKNELEYNQVKVSSILESDASIGRTIGLLWLKKELPL